MEKQAALKARDEEEGATSRSMPAAGPVGGSDDVVAAGEGVAEIQNVSPLDAPAVAAASSPQVITGLPWGYSRVTVILGLYCY